MLSRRLKLITSSSAITRVSPEKHSGNTFKSRASENRMLRRIFRCREQEISGGYGRIKRFFLFYAFSS
jgi:hypothetical protein